MPTQPIEGQGGGGAAPPTTPPWQYQPFTPTQGDWFGNFSQWFNQKPDLNTPGSGASLQSLLEWQRQGQQIDPTFTQWANWFMNSGQREGHVNPNPPSGPPGGGSGGGFPWPPGGGVGQGGDPGTGGPFDTPNNPFAPWMMGEDWRHANIPGDFGNNPWLTKRWENISHAADIFGLWKMLGTNPMQQMEGLYNAPMAKYGAATAHIIPESDMPYMDAVGALQAAPMEAYMMSDPSVSGAMRYAQGASDIAANQAMLQSGAMAQQLQDRRMNPAAIAAAMGQINRQAGAGVGQAASQGFSQGLSALQGTAASNQNAEMMARSQNQQMQQQINLANQAARMQANQINYGGSMERLLQNQNALNQMGMFNAGQYHQIEGLNQAAKQQEIMQRLALYQQGLGQQMDIGRYLFDWLMGGVDTPGSGG